MGSDCLGCIFPELLQWCRMRDTKGRDDWEHINIKNKESPHTQARKNKKQKQRKQTEKRENNRREKEEAESTEENKQAEEEERKQTNAEITLSH